MPAAPRTVDLDLQIRRSPESVRSWWIDLPDDYRAKDPDEQPYRIQTLRRSRDEREFLTHWRNPDGSTMQLRETLRLQGDGPWTFHIDDCFGVRIHDEFRAEPEGDGTRLHIHSTLTPKTEEAEAAADAIAAQMRQGWPMAARICERDAP